MLIWKQIAPKDNAKCFKFSIYFLMLTWTLHCTLQFSITMSTCILHLSFPFKKKKKPLSCQNIMQPCKRLHYLELSNGPHSRSSISQLHHKRTLDSFYLTKVCEKKSDGTEFDSMLLIQNISRRPTHSDSHFPIKNIWGDFLLSTFFFLFPVRGGLRSTAGNFRKWITIFDSDR